MLRESRTTEQDEPLGVKYRIAYQLIAGTENDTRSVPLWLPLPTAAGPYVVRVAVQLAGNVLVAATSEPFD